jgi:hypothetical protein
MNVALHVGMPKTATKTFQWDYFESHPEIRHVGKNKPEVPDWEGELIDAIVDTERHDWRHRRDELPDVRARLADEERTVVVSAEAFSMGTARPPKVDTYTIAERLAELFPEASVVFAVREQVDILESSFLQRLEPINVPNPRRRFSNFTVRAKFGGDVQTEFENWLDELLLSSPNTSRALDYYDYARLLDIYESFFDDVTVLAFERLRGEPDGYTGAFSGALGVESRPELIRGADRNQRLTTVHRWWNRATNVAPGLQSLLKYVPESVIGTVRERGPKLTVSPSEDQRRALRSYFAPSNAELADRTGLDLESYGYAIATTQSSSPSPTSST